MGLLGVDVCSEPWDKFGDVRDVGERLLDRAKPQRSAALAEEDIQRLLSKMSLFDKYIEADASVLINPEDVSASEVKVMHEQRSSSVSSASSESSSSDADDDDEDEEAQVGPSTPLAPSPLGLSEPILDSAEGVPKSKARGGQGSIAISFSALTL